MTTRSPGQGGGRTAPRAAGIAIGLAVLLAVGCGDGGSVVEDSDGAPDLEVTSPAFADGEPIPVEHTCEGTDTPPTIEWSDPPTETVSQAVVVEDPDAPGGVFTHLLIARLPADVRSFDAATASDGVVGQNDTGEPGWSGPCPPPDDDAHRYEFVVVALDTRVDLEPGFAAADLADAIEGNVVARGTLTGTFDR